MHGSIYLKTLRDLREQILIWSIGLALIAAANVLLFPSIQKFPGLISFLENMPPAIKAMVGDVRAMAQLEGFLRAKVYDPLPLLISIFTISQGSALIAGEIEQKSFDLLLSRPVSRRRIALAKFSALLTASLILVLVLAMSLILCSRFLETEVKPGYLLISALSSLPLVGLFAAVAFLGSCFWDRARRAATAAGILVVASYVFETFRLLTPAIRHWDSFSLFALQKAGWTLAGQFHPLPVLVLLGLTGLVFAGALVVLEKKDVFT